MEGILLVRNHLVTAGEIERAARQLDYVQCSRRIICWRSGGQATVIIALHHRAKTLEALIFGHLMFDS